MTDPVSWSGIAILAGAAGAVAARGVRLPAATGALLGGFVAMTAGRAAGWMTSWPDLGPLRSVLTAYLCLHLGVELDLTRLVRLARPILSTTLARSAAVMLFVGGAARACGVPWSGSLLLGAGAVGTSPAAIAAVS